MRRDTRHPDPIGAEPPSRRRRPSPELAAGLLALSVFAFFAIPLLTGARTLYFRDVFRIHFPHKVFGTEQLRSGQVPAMDPTRGLGQPFRGNPNALPMYPGNLLYLVLPFWIAFNLHFVLHWLLAALTMRWLALAEGQSRLAALMAGVTYAGSGWVLSCLSLYNVMVITAWWPLVLWGASRGDRRSICAAGIACGLSLYAAEPVTVVAGGVLLAGVAIAARGIVKGARTVVLIVGTGTLVALPQIVATLRVLPSSWRGTAGVGSTSGLYVLHPLRFVELLIPLPFGLPGELGRLGFWAEGIVGERLPLVMSLYVGVIALALALSAGRRHAVWLAFAGAGLALAALGGKLAVLGAAAGFARYPEKFLLMTAVALSILAGHGLDRARASSSRFGSGPWLLAALALLGAVVAGLRPTLLAPLASAAELGGALPGAAEAQVALWALALFVLGTVLALAVLALRNRAPAALVGLQILGALQLAPLVLTLDTARIREAPPWVAALVGERSVATGTVEGTFGTPPPPYRIDEPSIADLQFIGALDLRAAPGALFGLQYPLTTDPDGMFSPLYNIVTSNVRGLDWPARVPWLRALGVEAVVTADRIRADGLVVAERADRFGVATSLALVDRPVPRAWWPRELVAESSPVAGLALVDSGFDPLSSVVVPSPVEHAANGKVEVTAFGPDRIELTVESEGGVVVLRRAYQTVFRATSGETELTTIPVQVCLLGVVVPPGRHEVVVAISSAPERAAGAVAVVVFLGLVVAMRLAGRTGGDPRARDAGQ